MENRKHLNILTAMVLGDGCVTVIKNKPNALQFSIKHCIKQIGLLEYKRGIAEEIWGEVSSIKYQISRLKGKEYPQARFRITRSNDMLLTYLRNELYSEGVKRPTLEALSRIDAHGLAIWYMDDGSVGLVPSSSKVSNVLSYNLVLCTCYPQSYAEMTAEVLNSKFGLEFRLWRDNPKNDTYSLRLMARDVDKFYSIVMPYISQIPCMSYKIKSRNSHECSTPERTIQDEDIVRPLRKLRE